MKLTGYYTKAGEKIAAGLLAGKTLSIAKITAGSGSTSTAASVLDQEQQDLGPCVPEVAGTTAVIRCTLSSDQAKEPYYLRELGVYALDEMGQRVLYLIFRLDEQVSINPAFRLVLRFNLEQTLSDGAAVKVTAPLTGLAIQEDLKTKADLTGGQVPYEQLPHLTANRTLYVDTNLGDDTNTGTSANPFRTIQAAVNALPKNLDQYYVTIRISPGVYDEDVYIGSFIGGSKTQFILLNLTGTTVNSDDVKVRSIHVIGCAANVGLTYMRITDGVQGKDANILLEHVTAVKSAGSSADTGVKITFGTCVVSNSVIDGYAFGVYNNGSAILTVSSSQVKNCNVGICSGTGGRGGLTMLDTVAYSGNAANTAKANGGQIFGGD